ncbi:GtrA family protein [Sulfurimonas sp.]|uniref:GtrA family protein n=1 Tax=Sulfurimonas sp. TaxID=2022749 RepID=UPI003A7F10F0
MKRIVSSFILVGIMNTIFYYSIYVLFLYIGLEYSISVLLATILGVLFNFKTFGKYVFKDDDNKLIFRFISVYIVLYIVNITIINIFNYYIQNYYISGFLAIFPTVTLSFILNKKIVFTRSLND